MDVPISKDLADGDYLLRAEVIALHTAGSSGGAQFYMTCYQISISGGTGTAKPSTVSFPGAYKASDPGILVNIHSKLSGYVVPGGAVASIGTTKTAGSGCGSGCASTCDASKGPVGTAIPITGGGSGGTSPGTGSPPSCTVAKYAQCGGQGWTGCTTCAVSLVPPSSDEKAADNCLLVWVNLSGSVDALLLPMRLRSLVTRYWKYRTVWAIIACILKTSWNKTRGFASL